MGKVTGFMEFERLSEHYEEPQKRVKHYKEFVMTLSDDEAKTQGARCMAFRFVIAVAQSTISFLILMIWCISKTGKMRLMFCIQPITSLSSRAASAQHLAKQLVRLELMRPLWASNQLSMPSLIKHGPMIG